MPCCFAPLQANQLSSTNQDPDFEEYNSELRRGILDAYCGIVQVRHRINTASPVTSKPRHLYHAA